MPEESLDTLDLDSTASVDDFIRELEAKEKDLHITADLTIEIEDSEFDPRNIPDDIVPPQDRSSSSSSNGAAPQKPRSTTLQPEQPGNKTKIYELEQEVDSLKKRLSVLREERNDVQEKSDRRLKDFESYKYRMDRERRGAFIEQISNLAAQMLPIFDNLDRALDSAKQIEGEKSKDFEQFYHGIVLVNQQMAEVLQDMGIEPIKTVGEPFDPNFHEAVAVQESADALPNTIVEEMLRGYRIGNRVIRHSMVKVTTGAGSQKPAKNDQEEPAAEKAVELKDDSLLNERDIESLLTASLPDDD